MVGTDLFQVYLIVRFCANNIDQNLSNVTFQDCENEEGVARHALTHKVPTCLFVSLFSSSICLFVCLLHPLCIAHNLDS